MKKIIVLLYTLYALEDVQSLDVSEHKDLEEYLEEGLKVDHVSAPSIVQCVNKEGVPGYLVSMTVEMGEGENPRDMLTDYMEEIFPMITNMTEPIANPKPFTAADIKTGEEYELEIKELLVPELKARAEEYGIEGYKKMNKAKLISSLVELYKYQMFGTGTIFYTPEETKEETPPAEAPKENPPKEPKEATTPPPSQSKPKEKAAPEKPKITRAQAKRDKKKAKREAAKK